MSAPAEQSPETEITSPSSAPGTADETIAARIVSNPGIPAAPGFGPPAAPNEVGALGPYRVAKELGRGGMGAVYAAIDTRLDRRLALKVMLPEFAADAEAKARFLREARAAAKISHDNIVTVYEADERQGVPYIAMQFLVGYPLDQYLKKKGAPTVPQVLRIVAEAAAGLAAAHKIGLVHRDIKPGNLWLEAPNGRVKVLDFGLAKPVDAEAEVTKRGAVVGTPAYMSPEQARGEKVDHRTDLFSLGAVTYRLCTGKLPFTGPSTMAVLIALGTEEPPPVREVNPDVPESLAALVHQLLSKRADARPQSAAEVVKRVRAIAEELSVPRVLPVEKSTSPQVIPPQTTPPRVVYVPIQVTAPPPAENPFADLEASGPESASREASASSAGGAEPKPGRKKPGGKGTWVAAGLAVALAAAVIAGVVITLKNKSGSETKTEAPDGSAGAGKDGKTPPKGGTGKNPPVADTSTDRKAAEWVITQGGQVWVYNVDKDIKTVAELPKDRFTLTRVVLTDTKVTDAGLAHLKDCKGLTALALNGTPITGTGLEHLKDCKGLTSLDLGYTQVTDAGLEHLKGLKGLAYLDLRSVKMTDGGLAYFKECKGLEYLDVRNTAVTANGLADFHATVPGCEIQHDGGVIEPKK